MSGNPKNLEVVSQGGNITLDMTLREFVGGPLVNADSTPQYKILDPDGTTVITGTGTLVSVGVYEATYAVTTTAMVSDRWQIVWTLYVKGALVSDSEYFQVLPAGSIDFGNNIIISDQWFNLIKKHLGYPAIDCTPLLDDTQIKELCLFPALQEYFIKFPKIVREMVGIDGNLEIAFPDQNTYAVTDVRVVGKNGSSTSGGGSFFQLLYLNKGGFDYGSFSSYLGRRSNSNYGERYNPNAIRQATMNYRAVLETELNTATFKYFVNKIEKKVEIFSEISAEVAVTWAKFSNDFEDVNYPRRLEVIKLAAAELLHHMADSTQIVDDGNSDQTINVSDLRARAEALRTEVREFWNSINDIVVLRS